jgi:hypothetical protein
MSAVCTIVLAILAVLANWTKGVKDDGSRQLTPAGRGILVLILLVTIVSLRVDGIEKAETRAKAEHAQRTIDELRNETISNFERDVASRQWKSVVGSNIDRELDLTLLSLRELRINFERIQFADKEAKRRGKEIPTAALDDALKVMEDSIDAFFEREKAMQTEYYTLSVKEGFEIPDAKALLDFEALDTRKKQLHLNLVREKLFAEPSPAIISWQLDNFAAILRAWHTLMTIQLEVQYSKRLKKLVSPTSMPASSAPATMPSP